MGHVWRSKHQDMVMSTQSPKTKDKTKSRRVRRGILILYKKQEFSAQTSECQGSEFEEKVLTDISPILSPDRSAYFPGDPAIEVVVIAHSGH